MTRLFGFAQFDFAGRLDLADGRYLLRDNDRERVLVVETLGAPPPARRRRRRPREASDDELPKELPLTRATAVRAFEELETEAAAESWLARASEDEEAVDVLLLEAADDLNRALHVHAVASGNPQPQAISIVSAAAVRIGYGSGEQLADSVFIAARTIDPGGGPATRRHQRDEELRPQQRLAAVLKGRERLDSCETLILRARADLDAGRNREAALQLRVGLEALLVELQDALTDPGHEEDMGMLNARRRAIGDLANGALAGDLDTEQLAILTESLALCERVLRRRRILGN